MTWDEGGTDNAGGRNEERQRPPQANPTRHGSDPSRPFPSPEPLYLDHAEFAALWPRIEPRLFRRLVRDGFDPDTAKDLCQEVAGAFLRTPQRVRTSEELFEKALLASHRLAKRLRRRQARIELGNLPELAVPDIADEVERQYVVDAVVAAIDSLPEPDRIVFDDSTEFARHSLAERNRLYVRRHRALKRLRDRLRGWLVGVYVGRYLPRRHELLADMPMRAACVSAAVVVAGASLLQSNATPPTAATLLDVTAVSAQSRAVARIPSADSRDAAPNVRTTPRRPDKFAPVTRASGTSPTPSSVVPHPSPPLVETRAPLGTHAAADTDPRPPGDDSLVCWVGLAPAPDLCVQHPLRKRDK